MDRNSRAKKRLRIALTALFVVAAGGVALWFFWLKPDVTLAELQKQYLFAKTDAEKERIIDRVEQYYLNLEVPDSIRQRVDDAVQVQIDTTKIDLADWGEELFDEPNPYIQEEKLQALLTEAMIAKVQNDSAFDKLIELAKRLAKVVDGRTQNDYWCGFVDNCAAYGHMNALAAIRAEQALELCKAVIDSDGPLAEIFTSEGLKNLQVSPNERIRLNYMQRIQWSLYIWHGFDKLSMGLSKRNAEFASRIRDLFRKNAIVWVNAQVFEKTGRVEEAVPILKSVIQNSERYNLVPNMSWTHKNSLIQLANCYFQLSEFEHALSLCDDIEVLELLAKDQVEIHNIRGLVYQRLGRFDGAEKEYTAAVHLASSEEIWFNEVRCLNNLGDLFAELEDYDRALGYMDQASRMIQEYQLKDYGLHLGVLVSIANIMIRQNSPRLDSLMTQILNLSTHLGNLPFRQADLLTALARVQCDRGQLGEAIQYLDQAIDICIQNGLLRMELKYRLLKGNYEISRGNLKEARKEVEGTLNQASKSLNISLQIEALASLAEIEIRRGRIDTAIVFSDRLVDIVERTSFESSKVSLPFHQKVYTYLKNDVLYELEKGNIKTAFEKLGRVKALSYNNSLSFFNSEGSKRTGTEVNIDDIMSSMNENSLVLDYLVTKDSLYVFVLQNGKELRLVQKPIEMNNLRRKIEEVHTLLSKTAALFEHYESGEAESHFRKTMELSQSLYTDILGGLGLDEYHRDIGDIYIIPDEFLFQLPFQILVSEASAPEFFSERASIALVPSSSLLTIPDKRQEDISLSGQRVLLSYNDTIDGIESLVILLKKKFRNLSVLTTSKRHLRKKELLAMLKGKFDIWIIVGHGQANSIFPEKSFIELSVFNEITHKTQSIGVTLEDLEGIAWKGSETVLLVGCETAAGKLYRGTGVAGMHQAFISLGAKQVLATCWRIDAAQTIPQMMALFNDWTDTCDLSHALRQAQMTSIKELSDHPIYKAPYPYLWGAYSLYSTVLN